MASIIKRGTNSWRLIVELGYDSLGKRIKRTKTIRIEDEKLLKTTRKLNEYLDMELAKFKIEVETGLYITPEKMTFAAFVQEWKTKFVEQKLEAKTIENYYFQTDRRLLPYFGQKRIDQIKTIHILEYMKRLTEPSARIDGKDGKLGAASLVYNYRVLRSIFSKAFEWKIIKDNPMNGVSKPKEGQKEMMVYSEDEVRMLFEALQSAHIQFRVMVTLALTTGMRRAELLGLEWKHIDLDKAIIEVKQTIPIFKNGEPIIKPPKNHSSIRKISIPHTVVDELKDYFSYMRKEKLNMLDKWEGGDHSFLFCNIVGKPYYPKTLGDQWRAFHSKHLHLRYIRLHDLRHTSATLLINQGVHAKIISSRLGHSNIGTTMNVYGHVIQSADQAAASKFDSLFSPKKQQA